MNQNFFFLITDSKVPEDTYDKGHIPLALSRLKREVKPPNRLILYCYTMKGGM